MPGLCQKEAGYKTLWRFKKWKESMVDGACGQVKQPFQMVNKENGIYLRKGGGGWNSQKEGLHSTETGRHWANDGSLLELESRPSMQSLVCGPRDWAVGLECTWNAGVWSGAFRTVPIPCMVWSWCPTRFVSCGRKPTDGCLGCYCPTVLTVPSLQVKQLYLIFPPWKKTISWISLKLKMFYLWKCQKNKRLAQT